MLEKMSGHTLPAVTKKSAKENYFMVLSSSVYS